MADKAILYDATKCTACRGCQAACKQWHDLPGEETGNWGSYQNPRDLSNDTWLLMEFREVENDGTLKWLFSRRSCLHCSDAACVKVCPTGALYYHPLGFVSVDRGKCSNCGYCVDFCPFDVPRLDINRGSGLGSRIDKCTACTTPGLDRIDNGLEPACVKACPPNALMYGDRNEMLSLGRARVETLKFEGHSDARLYGETEVGGTHVLYVLEDVPQNYGLPSDPKVPAAAVAWQDVIKPLGYAAVGVVGLGLVLNIMIARARIITKEEK
jgi:formate dehydrogenase iron-sulfur subunit